MDDLTRGLKWADGSEVTGTVPLQHFPLNFTLLNHAGWCGLFFVALWFGWHWNIWTQYNWITFIVVEALFGFLTLTAPQISTTISERKLWLRRTPIGYDWLRYSRSRMKLLLLAFILTTSLLIWATGGLASPFIPFYIMVFVLALSYCRYPQPAITLTVSFVSILSLSLVMAEVPWIHHYVPAPVDDQLQSQINARLAKKLFDGGFVLASMLVPLISMFIASNRTPADMPAPPALGSAIVPADQVQDPTRSAS